MDLDRARNGVTGTLLGYLSAQGSSLKPSVVSFEFAWTRRRAAKILEKWDDKLAIARKQVKVDFAFLVAYPSALSLGCAMLADSGVGAMAALGTAVAWAVLLAAPLDAVENLALLRMLDRGADGRMALLAGLCASVKFVLVIAATVYLAAAGVLAAIG